MNEEQKNFKECVEEMRTQIHAKIDDLINQIYCTGILAKEVEVRKVIEKKTPLNNLPPDPARKEYTRRKVKTLSQVIKTQVCSICEKELPLGQFRGDDNYLHDESNQCREERTKETKTKKNKAS